MPLNTRSVVVHTLDNITLAVIFQTTGYGKVYLVGESIFFVVKDDEFLFDLLSSKGFDVFPSEKFLFDLSSVSRRLQVAGAGSTQGLTSSTVQVTLQSFSNAPYYVTASGSTSTRCQYYNFQSYSGSKNIPETCKNISDVCTYYRGDVVRALPDAAMSCKTSQTDFANCPFRGCLWGDMYPFCKYMAGIPLVPIGYCGIAAPTAAPTLAPTPRPTLAPAPTYAPTPIPTRAPGRR